MDNEARRVDDLLIGQKVDLAEMEMLKLPQAPCPVIHRFGPGIYIREVMIPAGTLAIGHHQNVEHMNIMLEGRVTVLNEDGSTAELSAPMMFVGKPGRKIGYVHEDMVWLNVYPTDETDVETLERTYLTKSDGWLESQAAKNNLLLLKHGADIADYHKMLSDVGFSDETVKAQSHDESDMTELPLGGYKIAVSKSLIEGKGLFATADIDCGEVIAPARISGKRTIAGRYTNHSLSPNAVMIQHGYNDINLVSVKPINGSRGGEMGDEITIDYRQALSITLRITSRQETLICQE